jgi:multiple sugar transport system ATP-binding protein
VQVGYPGAEKAPRTASAPLKGPQNVSNVSLHGIRKVFPNGFESLRAIDLEVSEGELLTVVGPSGSGKSTLLRVLTGLEKATAGRVIIGGRDVTEVPPWERDVSLVFQNPALYPHLSVFKNMAFSLKARGASGEEIQTRVDSLAGSLGLSGMLDRRPRTLSGGQRQRVALGRAFARRASVMLLDEPMSSLDVPLRASVQSDLVALHRRFGSTVIYVTHDQGEALGLGDRVAVIDQGRIMQVGTPEEVYDRPAHTFVAGFLGNPPMNVVRCHVEEGTSGMRLGFEGIPKRLETSIKGWKWGKDVDVGLRPEHLVLARESEGRPGKCLWLDGADVGNVAYLGHESIVEAGFPGRTMMARVPASRTMFRGDRVALGIDLARASWFDTETGKRLST